MRSPQQTLAKRRGEGTTEKPAKVVFERQDGKGEWHFVSARISEVNAEIEQLTGLSAEQFRQVMVLPQGEFRRLLTASSKERQEVFGRRVVFLGKGGGGFPV